jgi:SAM-dependent methyltransferase
MKFDYSRWLIDVPYSTQQYLAGRQLKILRPYLGQNKEIRILEIGPGNGLALKALADDGYLNAEGVEADEILVQLARDAGLNVHHVERNELIASLEGRQNEFDLIFCMHVIEHISVSEQLRFVRAISAALRSKGYFVCETPNALGPVALFYRYNDWTHCCLFTIASLRFLVENSDMITVFAGGAGNAVPPAGGIIITLIQRIAAPCLRLFSRGLWRFILVAELGTAGLRLPVHAAIRIVGQKH